MKISIRHTNLGRVWIQSNSDKICRLFFTSGLPSADVSEVEDSLLEVVLDVLEGRKTSHSIPLSFDSGTVFQKLVWENLAKIPFGQTTTYQDLAARIGMPRATRAVANACGANQIAILIPCHRVLRKDGSLGGYKWGKDIKHSLLNREAAKLDCRYVDYED